MVRIEKSIEIKAPCTKVWEMLAFDKAVEWMEGWKAVEYTSEVRTPKNKYRVGVSAHITEHVKYDFEITESLKNEKITWRSAGGRAKPKMIRSYTLEPTDTGTLVKSVFEYTSPLSVLGKIIDKTGGERIAKRDVEKSLEKLKSILEK